MVQLLTSALAAAALLTPGSLGAKLFVSHFSGKVYALTHTAGSNGSQDQLTVDSSVSAGSLPSWLTLDRTAGTLYAFDESWYGSGVLSSFNVSTGTPVLTGQARTAGNTVHGWLYGGTNGQDYISTAEYSGNSITTYKLPLSSSTSVLQKLSFSMTSRGPNPRQDSPHPHATITDPTGQYLLVPDLGADLIRIFSIGSSGQLTACTAAQAGSGDGPRHGTFWAPVSGSTSGLMLYTVNELGNSVTSWKVNYPAAGSSGGCLSLSKQQTLSTFASGSPPSSGSQYPAKAAEVHVRDNFLYASNRNDQLFGSQQDSIALYNIASTGAITFVEATNAHAWYPRTFSINKAGTLVAIGGQTSSNVAIVTRNASTGRLGSLVANVQVGSAGRDGQEDGLSAVTWNESGIAN